MSDLSTSWTFYCLPISSQVLGSFFSSANFCWGCLLCKWYILNELPEVQQLARLTVRQPGIWFLVQSRDISYGERRWYWICRLAGGSRSVTFSSSSSLHLFITMSFVGACSWCWYPVVLEVVSSGNYWLFGVLLLWSVHTYTGKGFNISFAQPCLVLWHLWGRHRQFHYYLLACVQIWYDGSRVQSVGPYPYCSYTPFLLSGVFIWRIGRLFTYYCIIVELYSVAFFPSLTGLSFFSFLCNICAVCNGSYRLSVTLICVGNSIVVIRWDV